MSRTGWLRRVYHVDDGFFPSVGRFGVDRVDAFEFVVFHAIERALVRHEPLASDEVARIDLQECEVWMHALHRSLEDVSARGGVLPVRSVGHRVELDLVGGAFGVVWVSSCLLEFFSGKSEVMWILEVLLASRWFSRYSSGVSVLYPLASLPEAPLHHLEALVNRLISKCAS